MRYQQSYEFGGERFGIGLPHLTTAVKTLILANVIVFLVQFTLGRVLPLIPVFALTPRLAMFRLMIWQFGTYLFLHAGVMHLFFNMLMLYMFGSEVEYLWGPRSFYAYYFFTGVTAGMATAIINIPMGLGSVPVLGASGAIYGIVVAFAMVFPNRIVYLFPIPVAIKAKYLAIGLATFSFLSMISQGDMGVAHAAHVAGAGFGYLYLKRRWALEKYLDRFNQWLLTRRYERQQKREQERQRIMREEIDPILDKVSRHGMHSLSRRERKMLKKARSKLL